MIRRCFLSQTNTTSQAFIPIGGRVAGIQFPYAFPECDLTLFSCLGRWQYHVDPDVLSSNGPGTCHARAGPRMSGDRGVRNAEAPEVERPSRDEMNVSSLIFYKNILKIRKHKQAEHRPRPSASLRARDNDSRGPNQAQWSPPMKRTGWEAGHSGWTHWMHHVTRHDTERHVKDLLLIKRFCVGC